MEKKQPDLLQNLLVTIGRSPDNIFPVFHPSVLPYHAEIHLIDDTPWLIDKTKGSKTWLLVDDLWVNFMEGPIFPEDTLRFAGSEPVAADAILAKSKLPRSSGGARDCKICKKNVDGPTVSSCQVCQGVFVSTLAPDTSDKTQVIFNMEPPSSILVPLEPQPRAAANSGAEAHKKKIRCLSCAAVFVETLSTCPDCGFVRLSGG